MVSNLFELLKFYCIIDHSKAVFLLWLLNVTYSYVRLSACLWSFSNVVICIAGHFAFCIVLLFKIESGKTDVTVVSDWSC